MQNMQTQAQLFRIQEQAWLALTNAGIQPVLMKGFGLAQYYPSPEQRQWGDIDLYVGPKQYHPACAVMRATFPKALKFDEELDHYKHYNLIADGVSIEVHRMTMGMMHPRDIRRYRKIEAYGMDIAHCPLLIGDQRLRVPEPTYNALFVMLHSWEHMMHGGANLRQVCDLALLLKHEQEKIDKVRLKRWLKELRLLEVWQLYMWMAVELFALREEEAPFYSAECKERAEALLNDIIEDKNIQNTADADININKENRWVRKWGTMRRGLRNAERLAKYSPVYARHMKAAVLLKGLTRVFAPDRKWE